MLSVNEFKSQLNTLQPTLNRLRTTAFGIISSEISKTGASHLPIQSRVKSEESASAKFERKKYKNPFDQMTDLIGFRIIVYLESDIEIIENALRNCFEIDEINSINKRNPTSVNSVGYRSLHLICSLGDDRKKLPEYQGIFKTCFEIQVRTALEHAWAEIEHQQNYKSESALPRALQRRLMILAGSLELVDRELSAISFEAEKYREKLKAGNSEIRNDELSNLTLVTLTLEFAKKNNITVSIDTPPHSNFFDIIIEELNKFKIHNVEDFRKLLECFPAQKVLHSYETTILGFCRDLMILNDYQRYFKDCFHGQYALTRDDLNGLEEAINVQEVYDYMEGLGYEVEPSQFEF